MYILQLEELERIERQRQLEEEERRRQQEELAELERRRSEASLLSMTSNDLDIADGPVNSTPRKSDDSGIGGYTDTAALLKEKLDQLSTNEDGPLEGIGKKRHAPPPPSSHSTSTYTTQDNVSLPPKRQVSDDGKSTTTGSYESEGSNEQW